MINPFTGETLNEWSDEARRKSAEKRKTLKGAAIGAGTLGGINAIGQRAAAEKVRKLGVRMVHQGIISEMPKVKFSKGRLGAAMAIGAGGGALIGRMLKKKSKDNG